MTGVKGNSSIMSMSHTSKQNCPFLVAGLINDDTHYALCWGSKGQTGNKRLLGLSPRGKEKRSAVAAEERR